VGQIHWSAVDRVERIFNLFSRGESAQAIAQRDLLREAAAGF
jgi:hypothetical protein